MTTLVDKEHHSLEFQNPSEQSFSGAVRQNLKVIEAQLEIGVRYSAIHKLFVEAGFKVGVNTFRLTLYRARLQRDGLNQRRLAKASPKKDTSASPATLAPDSVAKAAAPAAPRDYFARTSIFREGLQKSSPR